MAGEDKKEWASLPGIWPDFARSYIGPTQGRSDVMIGVSKRMLEILFPFQRVEDKMAHGRTVLNRLSSILGIPREDMNLGVRFDDFETLTAGYPAAVHYTYRHHNGRIEWYYCGNPKEV